MCISISFVYSVLIRDKGKLSIRGAPPTNPTSPETF